MDQNTVEAPNFWKRSKNQDGRVIILDGDWALDSKQKISFFNNAASNNFCKAGSVFKIKWPGTPELRWVCKQRITGTGRWSENVSHKVGTWIEFECLDRDVSPFRLGKLTTETLPERMILEKRGRGNIPTARMITELGKDVKNPKLVEARFSNDFQPTLAFLKGLQTGINEGFDRVLKGQQDATQKLLEAIQSSVEPLDEAQVLEFLRSLPKARLVPFLTALTS